MFVDTPDWALCPTISDRCITTTTHTGQATAGAPKPVFALVRLSGHHPARDISSTSKTGNRSRSVTPHTNRKAKPQQDVRREGQWLRIVCDTAMVVDSSCERRVCRVFQLSHKSGQAPFFNTGRRGVTCDNLRSEHRQSTSSRRIARSIDLSYCNCTATLFCHRVSRLCLSETCDIMFRSCCAFALCGRFPLSLYATMAISGV